jgi:hypothetical protein
MFLPATPIVYSKIVFNPARQVSVNASGLSFLPTTICTASRIVSSTCPNIASAALLTSRAFFSVTESWVLATVGGTVGVLIAHAVIQWFVSTRQDISRVEAIHMDASVVGFAGGLIFLCAFFAGLISSVSIRGDQVLPSLQESARSHGAGPGRVRLRKWLLSLEVGLTVVLLVGAGSLLKSYARLRASDLGCLTKKTFSRCDLIFPKPPTVSQNND